MLENRILCVLTFWKEKTNLLVRSLLHTGHGGKYAVGFVLLSSSTRLWDSIIIHIIQTGKLGFEGFSNLTKAIQLVWGRAENLTSPINTNQSYKDIRQHLSTSQISTGEDRPSKAIKTLLFFYKAGLFLSKGSFLLYSDPKVSKYRFLVALFASDVQENRIRK